jgi:hypothetical protein
VINFRDLVVLTLSVVGLASYAAHGQTTPGAIPNPGTYQGSMEIQRQQDQQAEQYRQQPTPTQSFQQSQGSALGRPTTPNPPRQPDCLDRLAQNPELAPLARKVYLGHPDVNSSALFGIQTVPSPSERPLLLKWLAGRRACMPEIQRIRDASGVWSVQAKRANDLSIQITNDMINDLAEGKLTYGQFNRQRTMNAITVDRTP